jgi:hypothetical protein
MDRVTAPIDVLAVSPPLPTPPCADCSGRTARQWDRWRKGSGMCGWEDCTPSIYSVLWAINSINPYIISSWHKTRTPLWRVCVIKGNGRPRGIVIIESFQMKSSFFSPMIFPPLIDQQTWIYVFCFVILCCIIVYYMVRYYPSCYSMLRLQFYPLCISYVIYISYVIGWRVVETCIFVCLIWTVCWSREQKENKGQIEEKKFH